MHTKKYTFFVNTDLAQLENEMNQHGGDLSAPLLVLSAMPAAEKKFNIGQPPMPVPLYVVLMHKIAEPQAEKTTTLKIE